MSNSIAGTESPSISIIEESLSLLARRASLPRIHAYMNSRAGTQLDWYAYIALYWIDAAGPMRLTELAHHFGVVPSTVCRHVQQLEREGLVEKTADPTDGRAVQLAPSDKGRRILAELKQARESTLEESLGSWSDKDLHTLAGLLTKLRGDLAHFGSEPLLAEAS
jgi:DNA-binding MarR family transcriptional regulator